MITLSKEELINQFKNIESHYIKFIQERLGIVIKPHQTNELQKAIINAYHKFNYVPSKYLEQLQVCQTQSPLLEHLIAGVTVGETYFFRDENQIALLKNRILKEIIQKKRAENNLSLRIWSAGSASGEEIYTIALLLIEAIPDIHKWSLNLLATDINTESLKKAIKGEYGEWSMRSISNYYKQRYFTLDDKIFTISQAVRDLVHFDYLNLNEDAFPAIFNGTNAQDLILCRNVFIYFEIKQITHVMSKFYACLVPGGYLLLGASDPVNISHTDFIFHHNDGLVFTRPEIVKIDEKVEKIKITKKPLKQEKITLSFNKHKTNSTSVLNKNSDINLDFQLKINQFLDSGKWHDVLNTISLSNEKNTKFSLCAQATALANLGKLQQAEKICQEILSRYSTDKESYFTYALILIELNQIIEAEKILRKTLYLDHQFVPAHFQLGLLLLRDKKYALGLKSLTNALTIAKSKDADEQVTGTRGLNYEGLVDILQHEIEIHSSNGGMKHVDENA